MESSIIQNQIRMTQLKTQQIELKSKRSDLVNDNISALNELKNRIINEILVWEKKYYITAPIKGKIAIHSQIEESVFINNGDIVAPRPLPYNGDIVRANTTVGHGANDGLIGPELMFAHRIDDYYDDPVLIIKTAWGGKSLAVDFRPPSAEGATGSYYNKIIQIVQNVTQNLETEFPDIGVNDYAQVETCCCWNPGRRVTCLFRHGFRSGC